MPDYVQIVTSVGCREDAQRMAQDLVERRLAACVQVCGPITSVYRWQGKVETAEEWLCVAKTTRDQYAAAEGAIRRLHDYDVPEILAMPITAGYGGYLDWLKQQLTDDTHDAGEP